MSSHFDTLTMETQAKASESQLNNPQTSSLTALALMGDSQSQSLVFPQTQPLNSDGLAGSGQQALPTGNSDKPEGETDKPQGEADKPEGETDKPQGEADKPEGETDKPDGETHQPQGETHQPQGETHQPQGETDKPQGETDKPRGEAEGAFELPPNIPEFQDEEEEDPLKDLAMSRDHVALNEVLGNTENEEHKTHSQLCFDAMNHVLSFIPSQACPWSGFLNGFFGQECDGMDVDDVNTAFKLLVGLRIVIRVDATFNLKAPHATIYNQLLTYVKNEINQRDFSLNSAPKSDLLFEFVVLDAKCTEQLSNLFLVPTQHASSFDKLAKLHWGQDPKKISFATPRRFWSKMSELIDNYHSDCEEKGRGGKKKLPDDQQCIVNHLAQSRIRFYVPPAKMIKSYRVVEKFVKSFYIGTYLGPRNMEYLNTLLETTHRPVDADKRNKRGKEDSEGEGNPGKKKRSGYKIKGLSKIVKDFGMKVRHVKDVSPLDFWVSSLPIPGMQLMGIPVYDLDSAETTLVQLMSRLSHDSDQRDDRVELCTLYVEHRLKEIHDFKSSRETGGQRQTILFEPLDHLREAYVRRKCFSKISKRDIRSRTDGLFMSVMAAEYSHLDSVVSRHFFFQAEAQKQIDQLIVKYTHRIRLCGTEFRSEPIEIAQNYLDTLSSFASDRGIIAEHDPAQAAAAAARPSDEEDRRLICELMSIFFSVNREDMTTKAMVARLDLFLRLCMSEDIQLAFKLLYFSSEVADMTELLMSALDNQDVIAEARHVLTHVLCDLKQYTCVSPDSSRKCGELMKKMQGDGDDCSRRRKKSRVNRAGA